MSDIFRRALTGFFIVLICLLVIGIGEWAVAGLFLVATGIGLTEYTKIYSSKKGVSGLQFLGLFSGILIYLILTLVFLSVLPWVQLLWVIPIFVINLVLHLWHDSKEVIVQISMICFGWLYIAVPFALLTYLAGAKGFHTPEILWGFFALLWTNDTGAYLSGRSIGKHPMFPRISPKKTWEGLAGGIILCLIVAFVISRFWTILDVYSWLTFAVLVAIFSNLGDLIESMIKRSYGVKDSGNILPGHGGVLDRFDGVFITIPLIVFYLTIFEII